jgi:HAD superfamily hydrolase (TIGR01509 family)
MHRLIVDMGNVVVFFDHRRACRQLAALGRPGTTDDEVFDRLFHEPLERQYDEGEISTAEFLAALRSHFGIIESDAAIARAWTDIFQPNETLARQLADLKQTAPRLVLASNTNELHFAAVRALIPHVIALFDALVLSFEVGARKPAERFYQQVLVSAGAAAEDCLYIDDRADFVAAAQALGMQGLVYQPGMVIANV